MPADARPSDALRFPQATSPALLPRSGWLVHGAAYAGLCAALGQGVNTYVGKGPCPCAVQVDARRHHPDPRVGPTVIQAEFGVITRQNNFLTRESLYSGIWGLAYPALALVRRGAAKLQREA